LEVVLKDVSPELTTGVSGLFGVSGVSNKVYSRGMDLVEKLEIVVVGGLGIRAIDTDEAVLRATIEILAGVDAGRAD
jgi:hypothetical protein